MKEGIHYNKRNYRMNPKSYFLALGGGGLPFGLAWREGRPWPWDQSLYSWPQSLMFWPWQRP